MDFTQIQRTSRNLIWGIWRQHLIILLIIHKIKAIHSHIDILTSGFHWWLHHPGGHQEQQHHQPCDDGGGVCKSKHSHFHSISLWHTAIMVSSWHVPNDSITLVDIENSNTTNHVMMVVGFVNQSTVTTIQCHNVNLNVSSVLVTHCQECPEGSRVQDGAGCQWKWRIIGFQILLSAKL